MSPGPVVDQREVDWEEETLPGERGTFFRKRLGRAAGGVGLGCSLVRVPPGTGSWPRHYHTANEEAVYVLAGRGTLVVGDERHELHPGVYAALPVGADYAHRVENDADEELTFLTFSTMVAPDVVVYPDSNKVGVFVGAPPGGAPEASTLKRFLDLDAVVDYWKDE